MKKIVFILLSLVLLTGCGLNKNVHVKDCTWSEDEQGYCFCKHNGEDYTGKVWSDDDETMCMEFDKGRFVSSRVFYDNGKVAEKLEISNYQFVETCYDKKGNEIPVEEYEKIALRERLVPYMQLTLDQINAAIKKEAE